MELNEEEKKYLEEYKSNLNLVLKNKGISLMDLCSEIISTSTKHDLNKRSRKATKESLNNIINQTKSKPRAIPQYVLKSLELLYTDKSELYLIFKNYSEKYQELINSGVISPLDLHEKLVSCISSNSIYGLEELVRLVGGNKITNFLLSNYLLTVLNVPSDLSSHQRLVEICEELFVIKKFKSYFQILNLSNNALWCNEIKIPYNDLLQLGEELNENIEVIQLLCDILSESQYSFQVESHRSKKKFQIMTHLLEDQFYIDCY